MSQQAKIDKYISLEKPKIIDAKWKIFDDRDMKIGSNYFIDHLINMVEYSSKTQKEDQYAMFVFTGCEESEYHELLVFSIMNEPEKYHIVN